MGIVHQKIEAMLDHCFFIRHGGTVKKPDAQGAIKVIPQLNWIFENNDISMFIECPP